MNAGQLDLRPEVLSGLILQCFDLLLTFLGVTVLDLFHIRLQVLNLFFLLLLVLFRKCS